MQIETIAHHKHPWIAHELLKDFEVEDVWRFPIRLEENHDVPMVLNQLMMAMDNLSKKGVAGWLFKLRFFLGRIFGWDEPTNQATTTIPVGSIRERYAQRNNFTASQLPTVGEAEFIPVYVLPNEALAEIENQTVHAGMHLGKVPFGKAYTVQMAVYVKPKGKFGRFYMALIKPFRLMIVYPAMMRMIAKQWGLFLENKNAVK